MRFFTRKAETERPDFVELPVPRGRHYLCKENGSIWMPLYIKETTEGDVVTCFEVPQSGLWTYRTCTVTGAPSIYPEGTPLHMYLDCFLHSFVLIPQEPDHDFYAEDAK
jgi:hypothetical protein